jgi:F-type H+-transporting ATPase subunit b
MAAHGAAITPDVAHGAAEAAAHGAEAAAHGGEHAATFPPFDPSLFASQLVWFAITFGILYVVLATWALPKVQSVLDSRASALRGDLEAAARESAAAEAAHQEMERVSAAARADARKLVEDMRAKAQAELAAEQAVSDKALAEQLNQAETRIQETRRGAIAQVSGVADDLAREIVTRLAPGVRA